METSEDPSRSSHLNKLGAVFRLELLVERVVGLGVDQPQGALWRRAGRVGRHLQRPAGHLGQHVLREPAGGGRAAGRRWRQQADSAGTQLQTVRERRQQTAALLQREEGDAQPI